jgi:hypothetical protein
MRPRYPWIVVVRTPALPNPASRLPLVLTRATPIGDVPRKCAPATTVWPLGWTATAPALSPAWSRPVAPEKSNAVPAEARLPSALNRCT